MLPTIVSDILTGNPPIADETNYIDCTNENQTKFRVEREVQVEFPQSDFAWLIFFSQPVWVTCTENEKFVLQVVDLVDKDVATDTFTMRTSLLTSCATGHNAQYCRNCPSYEAKDKLAKYLRGNAHLYPGPNTDINFVVDNDSDEALLTLDWDVRDMTDTSSRTKNNRQLKHHAHQEKMHNAGLLMYAMPHHVAYIHETSNADTTATPLGKDLCQQALRGSACLMIGNSWTLTQKLPPVSFLAPRPPKANAVGAIAKALKNDISFSLPDYFMSGFGDTYFSGKQLAKLGRILTIGEEISELCTSKSTEYKEACERINLFSSSEFSQAVDRLRTGVEVWINARHTTPFVYDSRWGGLVHCGCDFDEDTDTCRNKFPECPAFSSPGLNFGNGKC